MDGCEKKEMLVSHVVCWWDLFVPECVWICWTDSSTDVPPASAVILQHTNTIRTRLIISRQVHKPTLFRIVFTNSIWAEDFCFKWDDYHHDGLPQDIILLQNPASEVRLLCNDKGIRYTSRSLIWSGGGCNLHWLIWLTTSHRIRRFNQIQTKRADIKRPLVTFTGGQTGIILHGPGIEERRASDSTHIKLTVRTKGASSKQ